MFWMRNEEKNFPIRTLIWRPDSSEGRGEKFRPEDYHFESQVLSKDFFLSAPYTHDRLGFLLTFHFHQYV